MMNRLVRLTPHFSLPIWFRMMHKISRVLHMSLGLPFICSSWQLWALHRRRRDSQGWVLPVHMGLSSGFMHFRALHLRLNELIKGAIQRMAQESSLTAQATQMSEQLAQLQQVPASLWKAPTRRCLPTVLHAHSAAVLSWLGSDCSAAHLGGLLPCSAPMCDCCPIAGA